MERLMLPDKLRAAVIAHAQAGWPEEVCGLLAGRDNTATEWHPGLNVSPTPRVTYELDVDTLFKQVAFEEAGLKLVGIYHSHPRGPETPSATDIGRAFYPDAVYLICSLAERERPVLRGFRISDGRVTEVSVA